MHDQNGIPAPDDSIEPERPMPTGKLFGSLSESNPKTRPVVYLAVGFFVAFGLFPSLFLGGEVFSESVGRLSVAVAVLTWGAWRLVRQFGASRLLDSRCALRTHSQPVSPSRESQLNPRVGFSALSQNAVLPTPVVTSACQMQPGAPPPVPPRPIVTASDAQRSARYAALRQNLLVKVGYETVKVDRLVAYERSLKPGATDDALLASAIERWERDNR